MQALQRATVCRQPSVAGYYISRTGALGGNRNLVIVHTKPQCKASRMIRHDPRYNASSCISNAQATERSDIRIRFCRSHLVSPTTFRDAISNHVNARLSGRRGGTSARTAKSRKVDTFCDVQISLRSLFETSGAVNWAGALRASGEGSSRIYRPVVRICQ